MIKHALLAGVAASFLFMAPAKAEVVTYKFTTTITAMQDLNFDTWIGTPITSSMFTGMLFQVGDTAHGQFSYNTEHPVWTAWPTDVWYNGWSAGTSASVHFDNINYDVATRPDGWVSIQVTDASSVDSVHYRAGRQWIDYTEVFSFMMIDNTGTALSSVALPTELSLADFSTSYFSYAWIRGSDKQAMAIEGKFTSFERVVEAEVPEPASVGLVLAGLGLLGLRRRRV